MYLVLALCSVMLLVSIGVALALIGGLDLSKTDGESTSTVDSASMVTESGYNKEENTIDTQAYTSTILEESADAGESYIDETLFWATATRRVCTVCSTIAPTITPSVLWA